METESKQAWGWFGLQSKPIRAFGAEGCVWPQAFAMLTSRGGFCSYWTFLRAVLMLESPSPVFFFFFFIWKPGKVSSQIKVDISGDWIWVFSKGCASDEMRFMGVYCAPSVLNSPWYLPADLPSSLTDISGLGFAFFCQIYRAWHRWVWSPRGGFVSF